VFLSVMPKSVHELFEILIEKVLSQLETNFGEDVLHSSEYSHLSI
jgi:hypothetical protein